MKSIESDGSMLKRLGARRLMSVLQGKVVGIYYRVMLRLNRERDELNISGATKQDMLGSRRSSQYGGEFLSLNKTFSSISAGQPIRNVRQFAALIGKKLFLAKLQPFQRLKRNLQRVRLNHRNIDKGAQQIKDLLRKHMKRLKRQAYFTLVGCSYSHARNSQADLKKQMNTATRKSGQNLIRLLKKLYRNKLLEGVKKTKDYSQRVGILQRLDKVVCRILNRSRTNQKKEVIKQLRKNTRLLNILRRTVSFSNVLFTRLVQKSLRIGWRSLRTTVKRRSQLLTSAEKLGGLLLKLNNRRVGSAFNRLYLQQVEAGLLLRAVHVAKLEMEESEAAKRKEELGRYEQTLAETERLLKTEEVENQQLVEKLIELEKTLAECRREERYTKQQLGRLERELKQKDSTIKRLLIEQNRTNEFLAKQKDDILQLRLGRSHACECIEGKNREFAELTQTGKHLSSLIEAHIETGTDQAETEMSETLRFMRHQYLLFKGVLEQSEKMIGAFSLNPLFRNDYPVLSYLRGSFRQISEFINNAYATFLAEQTVERYIMKVRALPQDRQFDALELNRLTTQIIDQLRPNPQTSGYQLVRSKIIEFSRASESFNRQYRRLLEKNSVLKNLLIRLDSAEKDMQNYLTQFHDVALPTGRVTSRRYRNEASPDNIMELLRPLFLDFLSKETSYHKKRNIREKLTALLELTSEEQQLVNGHS